MATNKNHNKEIANATMKYYEESNYRKGVALFKNGAAAVLIENAETSECWEVSSLTEFKKLYKWIRELYLETVDAVYACCQYYEVDAEAKAEAEKDWPAMPMPDVYIEAQFEEMDEMQMLPCGEFCKHYRETRGFPGEILYCCSHPKCSRILCCESVFDGVTDGSEIDRILDAIC